MEKPPSRPSGTAKGPAAARGGSGWRLAVLLVSAILMPGLILAAAAASSWRWVHAEAERELLVAADAASEFALRVVEGHGRLSGRIAESLAGWDEATILAAAPVLRGRIGSFIAGLPLVQAALVTRADGSVLVWAAQHSPSGDAPAELILPALAAVDAETLVSAAFRVPGLRAPAFAIARQWEARGGAVALLLDASLMSEGLRRVVGTGGDSAALVRRDGEILARVPGFVAPPPLGPDRPLIEALAEDRVRGRIDGVTPLDGRPVRIGFRVLEGTPGLIVAAAKPREMVLDRWWSTLLPLLAVAGPAMLALAGLAWMVRARQRALEAALAGLEERVAERTASLREGEERLRLAVGAGRIGIWETDLRSGLTTRSARTLDILGMPGELSISPVEHWSAHIHPADRARVIEAWERSASGRQPNYREEYRYRRPDGTWRWIESTAAAVRVDGGTGKPVRIAGTSRDITERREAEERRELLTQEVNHRARNTLTIVQAILRLTRAEDATSYARLVEGRIAALARAQSLLAAECWTGAPFLSVLTAELAPFGSPDARGSAAQRRFALAGAPLRLKAEAVQPLAMVFHELAANAAKHGALSRAEGRVSVDWHPDESAGVLRIRWVETGGPPPGLPGHRGVGSRVVEATVSGQLGGSVERRWPDEGLVCDIAVPLARVRAGPA